MKNFRGGFGTANFELCIIYFIFNPYLPTTSSKICNTSGVYPAFSGKSEKEKSDHSKTISNRFVMSKLVYNMIFEKFVSFSIFRLFFIIAMNNKKWLKNSMCRDFLDEWITLFQIVEEKKSKIWIINPISIRLFNLTNPPRGGINFSLPIKF